MRHGKINWSSVLKGGAAAGVVHFLVTGVVNGGILQGQIHRWMADSGSFLHPLTPAGSMPLWALMSLTYGFVGVWLYGSVRQTYGAGAKSALLTGIAVWLVSKFTVALDFITLGLVPEQIVIGLTIGGLAAMLLALLVGAWVYRD